jgi:autotransporter-associated beta strand protein
MDGGASVRTAHYVIADNPDVPVEMVLNGKIDSNNWPKSNQDGIVKQGDGVMRLTAENEFGGANNWQGTTKVSGGTLLVDNVSGSGTGKSWVWVEAGATLGGTGRIGGLQDSENARLSIGGSSEAAAVVHPGTIDDATGEHIAGMLTAGSTDQACPTAFNNYSKLAISVCERGAVDSLAVYGSVTISDTGSVLDIVADGIAIGKAKGGTYTILSATEGIVGTFATVQKPKNSWKVTYVSETVGEETVVKSILLAIPSKGLAVYVR